jgi:hypothetical protein
MCLVLVCLTSLLRHRVRCVQGSQQMGLLKGYGTGSTVCKAPNKWDCHRGTAQSPMCARVLTIQDSASWCTRVCGWDHSPYNIGHSSGRGRAAAARVETLCATAVVGARRPMPSWPTAVCPCGPSSSASPHGRLRGGPGGPVLFSAVPPPGLCPTAPWRFTPAPPLVRS